MAFRSLPFLVDNWTTRQHDQRKPSHYFLSHMHTDHTHGLSSNWTFATIHCSITTAALLVQKYQINQQYIRALPMNTPTLLSTSEGQRYTVSLIDANHCPGAVMFLFQGNFGIVMHTGDFRFDPKMVSHPLLSQVIGKVFIF
jgi:DNA cross-link repair 1B protein